MTVFRKKRQKKYYFLPGGLFCAEFRNFKTDIFFFFTFKLSGRKISQDKMVNHSYHECYENSITQSPNSTNLLSSSHFSVCVCMCSGSPEVDTWCLHLCCARPFSGCWGWTLFFMLAQLHLTKGFISQPSISFTFIIWFLYLVDLNFKKNNEILLAFLKSISKSDSLCLKAVIISPLHLWSSGTSATCYVDPFWKEVPG